MIKLLWRFALLVLLAIAFAWLADRPGSVTIHWLGREIQLSVVVAVALAVAAIAILLFLWNMLRHIWRSPRAAREYWRFRKHRKGYEALSKGIIAAGAGDSHAASRNAALAGNTLSDEPLVNVLAAQAAQLKGDKANVKRIFEEMASNPDTELFGLRGLFAEARNSGDLVAALKHAERAVALNPRLPWASSAVLQVQTARKNWEAAALTLEQQGRNGLMERPLADKKRAALLTAEAMNLEDGDKAKALKLAQSALDLDPALVPAACVAARCHLASDSNKRALRLLSASWKLAPHPDLAELICKCWPTDSSEAVYERLRDTLGDPLQSVEAGVALAKAALTARRLDVARDSLAAHSASLPQARVCALMARIEDMAGEPAKAREWLARAIHATRDPMWVSDGVANLRWVPISPVTGEIVPCEWRVPFDVLPAEPDLLPPAPSPATAVLSDASAQRQETSARPPVPDDPGIGSADD